MCVCICVCICGAHRFGPQSRPLNSKLNLAWKLCALPLMEAQRSWVWKNHIFEIRKLENQFLRYEISKKFQKIRHFCFIRVGKKKKLILKDRQTKLFIGQTKKKKQILNGVQTLKSQFFDFQKFSKIYISKYNISKRRQKN